MLCRRVWRVGRKFWAFTPNTVDSLNYVFFLAPLYFKISFFLLTAPFLHADVAGAPASHGRNCSDSRNFSGSRNFSDCVAGNGSRGPSAMNVQNVTAADQVCTCMDRCMCVCMCMCI